MTELLSNVHLALPELIVLSATVLALVGDLFLRKRIPSIAFAITVLGIVFAGLVSGGFIGQYETPLFNGLFISDDIGHLLKLFIYIAVFLSFYYAKYYIEERQVPSGEYYVLGSFSMLGMMVLVSAHSMLTIYLGIELLSLPLYALVAIQRRHANGSEAAMKYFVMGAIASGMLLYGISLIYGATGQLDLQKIASALSNRADNETRLLAYALVFIVAGLGFKLAVMPFHMWAPDVYSGAPTSVTLLISTAPKIAAVGMALRVLTQALPALSEQWQQLILIMALLSAGAGNLFAIVQTDLKRLLAYSSISHMGYVLFGLLSLSAAGYAAALYYVVVYALMAAAAFGLLVLLSRAGQEIDQVNDLKGLNKRNPWLAFMMMIVMFSMAGVPPTVGFFTKFLVLKALVDAQMLWVALLGLIFAVIGAFYYLRVVKVMYFTEPDDLTHIKLPRGNVAFFSLNCLALLFLGIFPNGLMTACMNTMLS